MRLWKIHKSERGFSRLTRRALRLFRRVKAIAGIRQQIITASAIRPAYERSA